tara:strand:+ start:1013 stop:1225 length:213 start_codon:yes stop_codon:yes gene_type:complete
VDEEVDDGDEEECDEAIAEVDGPVLTLLFCSCVTGGLPLSATEECERCKLEEDVFVAGVPSLTCSRLFEC